MRSRLIAAAAALLALPASASAATVWKVQGGGFGHGIGMSQYGAYGYAEHGFTYDQILAHYYSGTALGSVNPALKVKVLIDSEPNSVAFTGATSAGGRALVDGATYQIRRATRGRVALYRGGRWITRFPGSSVTIRGGESVRLREATSGRFRGALSIGRAGSRLQVVNVLGLDNYAKGVVPGEMPSSWLPEALKVQAVAARTYAVATGAGTHLLYSDTRSQVYHGMDAETKSSNAAVTGTRGKVVTYDGAPIVTYYFSTSGGHTESIENVFCPSAPSSCKEPYLRGVSDPYEAGAGSPYERWTRSLSAASLGGRLGVGTLRGWTLVKRGTSSRIVYARFTGSGGSTTLTGPQLRSRLGLLDAPWTFRKITSTAARAISAAAALHGAAGATSTPTRVTAVRHQRLVGAVVPGRRGARVAIERRTNGGWVAVGDTQLGRHGGFGWTAAHPGVYRVRAFGLAGPAVRLR